jgi:hypothetical protein
LNKSISTLIRKKKRKISTIIAKKSPMIKNRMQHSNKIKMPQWPKIKLKFQLKNKQLPKLLLKPTPPKDK